MSAPPLPDLPDGHSPAQVAQAFVPPEHGGRLEAAVDKAIFAAGIAAGPAGRRHGSPDQFPGSSRNGRRPEDSKGRASRGRRRSGWPSGAVQLALAAGNSK